MNTPPSTSNGMAIAGFVLGLSGLVLFFTCGFGILLCVLGIVFGFIGMSKAKTVGKGRGMSLAGIILGAVGIIGGILFIVLIVVLAGDSESFELETTDCSVDGSGFVTFEGTLENTGNFSRSYTIDAVFRDGEGGPVLDRSSTIVFVDDDDIETWSITGSVDQGAAVRCEVSDVDSF